MKHCRYVVFLLTAFVIAPTQFSVAEHPPNILLICVDDLRPELNCFGADYIHSPNIDRLAKSGCVFTRHYVQAPTCGASRAAMLTGRYSGNNNGALFKRAKQIAAGKKGISPSMPAWFRSHGYTTVSVGKVSHHPGGRGGKDWDDNSVLEMPESWDRHLLPAGAWKHPRGWMHGLANGEIRNKANNMDVFQAIEGNDTIYPDGISTNAALEQLDKLVATPEKPFFLAVGILRPHLPFGAPAKYRKLYDQKTLPPIAHPDKPKGKTTWHRSGEFMKYNRWKRNPNKDPEFATDVRKHYAACVSFADAQVGRLLDRLEKTGVADKTIVVLWGDHGWHLGEHGIWGKHSLFEESLRSPLIVRYPGMKSKNMKSSAVIESVDLFPSLCELTKLSIPTGLQGSSMVPLFDKPSALEDKSRSKGKFDVAVSYFGNRKTIRTDTHRLIVHRDGFSELYDHRTKEAETKNIATENLSLVKELKTRLQKQLDSKK